MHWVNVSLWLHPTWLKSRSLPWLANFSLWAIINTPVGIDFFLASSLLQVNTEFPQRSTKQGTVPKAHLPNGEEEETGHQIPSAGTERVRDRSGEGWRSPGVSCVWSRSFLEGELTEHSLKTWVSSSPRKGIGTPPTEEIVCAKVLEEEKAWPFEEVQTIQGGLSTKG